MMLVVGLALGVPLGAWLSWLRRSRAPGELRWAVELTASDVRRVERLGEVHEVVLQVGDGPHRPARSEPPALVKRRAGCALAEGMGMKIETGVPITASTRRFRNKLAK